MTWLHIPTEDFTLDHDTVTIAGFCSGVSMLERAVAFVAAVQDVVCSDETHKGNDHVFLK